jgi:long-subunit acyl-CoA synthetase (AMP-forming)
VTEARARRAASGGPLAPPAHENLYRAFEATVATLGDAAALRWGDDQTVSWNDLRSRATRIAGGLAALGVRKGDAVAIMLPNRPEFMSCDLGAVALGAVPFSIYQTSSPEQIAHVVSDSGAKVAIVDAEYLDRFEAARADLPGVEELIVVGGGGDRTLAELEALEPGFDVEPTVAELGLDDLLTLIYTSGTTGPPKGVQLTHRNLLTLVASVEGTVPLPGPGEGRVISWLPAAHIAERGAHYYLPVVRGIEVTICPDPRRIVEFLPKVRPTWFFAVPRVWEKLKSGLEAMVAGLPDDQREPARRGLDAALAKVRAEQAGKPVPADVGAAAAQADEQMFAALRTELGLDRAVAVSVGAAPTPLEVLEFFHAIGIPVGELWGMSETCGVATVNPPDAVKLGTVGPAVPGIDLQLADDGEVLVHGPGVMTGYRNLPDETAEAFDGHWLRTGDIGALDDDGYLRIVDRKKELIINAAGKNMSPANIESHLKASSPLIGQAIAIGDGRPYNVALITLDPDFAPVFARQRGIEGGSAAALVGEQAILDEVSRGVGAANAKLARVEQIKKFKLLAEDWPPGGDELTPTMKLKRRPIDDKYAAEIAELYAG